MKKYFRMMGTFCDECGENLSFCNSIGLYKGEFKKPTKEISLCDDDCKKKFLAKAKNKSWR
jgi:hypothetical protein